MEYNYPKFTPEMKKTHTILIPNMAITQFRLLEYALRFDGYKCEILGNCGSAVAQLGLKYVDNDTCYPALLVIGQFLDALNSGKYDLEHTALLITQTGGGCRASNYIHLLRKALVKAGYPHQQAGGHLTIERKRRTIPGSRAQRIAVAHFECSLQRFPKHYFLVVHLPRQPLFTVSLLHYLSFFS